jgi:hypothetical protein
MKLRSSIAFAALLALSLSCGGPPSPNAPADGAHTPTADAPDGPLPKLRVGSLAPTEVKEPLAARVQRAGVDAGMETLEVRVTWPEKVRAEYSGRAGTFFSISVPGSTAFSFVGTRYDHDGLASNGEEVSVWVRRPASLAGTPVAMDLYAPRMSEKTGGVLMHARADDAKSSATSTGEPSLLPDWEHAFADRLDITTGWGSRRGAWQAFASARMKELEKASRPSPPPPPASPPPTQAKPAKSQAGKPAAGTKPTNAKPGAKPTAPSNAKPPAKPAPSAAPRPEPARATPPPAMRPSSTNELSGLMDTTTGALAVQEALQADRPLFLAAAHESPSIAIATLKRPQLAPHPWEKMSKKLSVAPPREPLAEATPAEFYFVRAASFDAFSLMMDQADTWGTPAARAFEGDAFDYGLAARYEAELGLVRGPLSRAFGSQVVSELAVVGSDPYFREGTDVTIVFRVKDHALFTAGISAAIAEHAKTHGEIAASQATMAGVAVSIARSSDGTVRQHRAALGDLEIVSNSPTAIARVLEAAQGKRARLSDEVDFKYMLARDAKAHSDVLAYMGDRFVGEVTGPKQKIGEVRRQLALGELLTPGFASLLYGFMFGKSPASADDLVKAHVLDARELTHASGGAIAWKPGEAARSSWGTPSELVPLIDLPSPDLVTESEKQSYERFAEHYQYDWGAYIDPVALRLDVKKVGDRVELAADMRELPLIDGSGYDFVQREAGDVRFDAPPLASGARVVLALGDRSRLRGLLSESRGILGRQVDFDWLGDFVEIGSLDRSAALQVVAMLDKELELHLPQLPSERDRRSMDILEPLSHAPFYAEIAIKNPVGAAVALTALRSAANDAAPGLVTWGEAGKYRDVPIVRITMDKERAKREFETNLDFNMYYAITRGAIVVTLERATLEHLIDARLDDRAPKPAADKKAGSQLSVEAASDKGHAVWTALAWVFEGELLGREAGASAAAAEALFRGAPERAADATAMRALAFATFGVAPLTTDGAAYSFGPEGLRDPVRGSAYAPSWPDVPVPGSPVEALMRALTHARADLSFDDEGEDDAGKKMQSLHARVSTSVR